MNDLSSDFVVCLQSDGEDDLVVRKVYRVIRDEAAGEAKLLRVIDDSGEDYLYPAEFFAPVFIPQAAAEALREGRATTG